MSAKVKMPRQERVPWELLSKFNAAHAEYLDIARQANEKIQAFKAARQKEVDAAGEVYQNLGKQIAETMKIDQAAGDQVNTVTGIVKRGAKK